MPQTKSNAKPNRKPAKASGQEVLTLTEASAYLRVSESAVLGMIQEDGLPARKVPDGWRILREAIQDWLRNTAPTQGIWASVGAFKDDPELETIVKEAYRRRGRSPREHD